MQTVFTPLTAVTGGLLIGSAAALHWLFNGRIAGIAGIFSRALFAMRDGEFALRISFIAGLVAAPWIFTAAIRPLETSMESLPIITACAGFLVGFGVYVGNGCTSGHGICGIGRLSGRSAAATATFMLTAMMTVFAMRHGMGL